MDYLGDDAVADLFGDFETDDEEDPIPILIGDVDSDDGEKGPPPEAFVFHDDSDEDNDFASLFAPPVAVPAPAAKAKAKAKPKADLNIQGKSANRSPLEHAYVMSKAREQKAKRKGVNEIQNVIEVSKDIIAKAVHANRMPGIEVDITGGFVKMGKKFTANRLAKVRKFASSKVRKLHLKTVTDVWIAFDMSIRASDVARSHAVSRLTARKCSKTVADCLHKSDLQQLRGWREICRRHSPVLAVLTIKWDEAKSTMRFPVRLKDSLPLNAAQSVIPLHVLQSARKLVLAWEDKIVELPLKSVPVPLVVGNSRPSV